MSSMNILITNDDGIAAPGIWVAAKVLAGLGKVTIVAPANNCSGYGAALPPARSISCFPYHHSEGHPDGVMAYGLAGTPATCAHTGLSGVLGGGPFDLVVSGVNQGANLGRDVFYSGTVGAALTAHLLGVPAIAISLAAGLAGVAHWAAAARALRQVVDLWQANAESAPVLFNVNVPNLPSSQLLGILITAAANTSCLTRYRFERDPHVEHALMVLNRDVDAHAPGPEPGTDAWAVQLGYVAVTPFRAIPDLLHPTLWTVPSEVIAAPIDGGRFSVLSASPDEGL